MPSKYDLPPFLKGKLERTEYARWLHRKALAHTIRDRRRWKRPVSVSDYKQAIHAAVVRSRGRDYYTGEKLDWLLISRYDNQKSRSGGSAYKKQFALLPTVDHVDPDGRTADFAICSWRTNDCKNDLSLRELKAFCRRLLANQQRS